MKLKETFEKNKQRLIEELTTNSININDIDSFDKNETINCTGSVQLVSDDLTEIPLTFGRVDGNFMINHNDISSLKNCPTYVGRHFDCSNNKKLASLEFGPKEAESYSCEECDLTSLEGAPKEVDQFECYKNLKLKSLKNGPIKVTKFYNASKCDIQTLEGFPEEIEILDVEGNKIKSLSGIHKIIKSCKEINISNNPITEGGIGLILIKNIEKVRFAREQEGPFSIIQKYMGQGQKGILACSRELTEAGFKDFAKL